MLETVVLVLLKQRPNHGYALLAPIQELGLEVRDLSLSRLYRALRNLEGDGIVASSWDTSAHGKGPARKIYSITGLGHRHLRQRMKSLRATTVLMQRIESKYEESAAKPR